MRARRYPFTHFGRAFVMFAVRSVIDELLMVWCVHGNHDDDAMVWSVNGNHDDDAMVWRVMVRLRYLFKFVWIRLRWPQ